MVFGTNLKNHFSLLVPPSSRRSRKCGKEVQRTDQQQQRRQGDVRRAILPLLFLGGEEGALTTSSPVYRKWLDGSGGAVETN